MPTLKHTFLVLAATTVVGGLSFSFPQGLERVERDLPPVGAPGGQATVLSPGDQARFERGRELFDRNFHRSDGLGTPELNADSCRACHQDPVLGGAGPLELNVFRFARDDGGTSFQDLAGGQVASKLRPPYVAGRETVPAEADVFEQRQTPSILGAGLVDGILDATILANEDPTDADGDGIFGVARLIDTGWATEVGKYGWKAQIPKLGDFVKDAMGGECGITTPDDGRGFALVSDADSVADPELTQTQVDDITFFLANLAAPQRRGGDVAQGELVFETIGCAKCHIPTLDSIHGPVPLYSDLLLHNVMRADFRGMSEPGAGVGMFKTPPLWGIGDTAPYMHDGRAESLRTAILAHFGEAQAVKRAFTRLSSSDKQALLRFLEDL